jgi:hypothetical protein
MWSFCLPPVVVQFAARYNMWCCTLQRTICRHAVIGCSRWRSLHVSHRRCFGRGLWLMQGRHLSRWGLLAELSSCVCTLMCAACLHMLCSLVRVTVDVVL